MRWKGFLLCHLLIALLAASFLLPWTRPLWDQLDSFIFTKLNQSLHLGEGYKTFWALANHRYADWLEDIFILSFYSLSIFKAVKFQRLRRTSQFIFCVLYIALTIILVNRLCFRDLLSMRRFSPTLTIDGCVRLSEELPWLDIKDETTKSFPGDHATSALLFALTYAFISGKRLGTAAIFYAIFLCLPRLIAGAHWFSDIAVGTGCIVLFSLAWGFFTPLHDKMSGWIEKGAAKLGVSKTSP
ncbi:MAG TPA: phosphatase PAP2 family protein [Rhabdochlamydiaceae bacterium]|nr:phosphatase PAP2 family protein [Rhabdochlamydiaceae bacterium]